MGNACQKLGLVLQNRTTNVLILAVLLITHLALVGMMVGLLSNKEVISLLYTLIMVMIFHAIDRSVTESLKRGPIPPKGKFTGVIRPVKEYLEFTEIKSTNLFIDRWKKLNLYRSPEFPLERLAFLNATTYDCQKKHFFYLRNSQVKQLSVKKVSPKHCDEECHPKKLVTDLFGSYVHRRSLFYKNRNVCAAGKRQLTKAFSLPRSEKIDSLKYSMLYGKEDEKKLEKIVESDELSSDKSSEKKGPRKYFKSMKRAVSSAVEGLMPESTHKSKKSDKDDNVNFVER
ncbi:hypothetical protein HNY73_018066 [Argiope bruennichi]|uniref:Uncharacterized protein n=1 Tax=Argiope bruennichi TaxID=94029 RepID=A0A8T0EC11_ARGBR|nr:hypothetical protein HNY73_018066 [Argiope bruennichi]